MPVVYPRSGSGSSGVSLRLLLLVLAPAHLAFAQSQPARTIRGRVLDSGTDVPVARALVRVSERSIETVTDEAGRFIIPGLPEGETEVTVTGAGYVAARVILQAGPGSEETEIRLPVEPVKLTEEISVTASPFEPRDPAAPGEHVVSGTELQSLADGLSGDPLRAVQSLPGVTSADDFDATFAARGSDFAHTGFYLDGVLLNSPFHTIRDVNDTFSLTVVNGDVVESIALINGGAPARYGNRTGSVLNLSTREGTREGFGARLSLGATGAYVTLEGPLGAGKSSSWLVSARKSYLGYLLRRIDSTGMGVEYADVTAKLVDQIGPRDTLALSLVHGQSRWENSDETLPPSAIQVADAGTDLVTLRWRRLSTGRSWGDAAAFASRETGKNRSADDTDRLQSASAQWGVRSDWGLLGKGHRLEAGVLARRLSEDAVARKLDKGIGTWGLTKDYGARGLEWGAYVQDGFTPLRRVRLTLGGRVDGFDTTHERRFSPRASLSWTALSHTTLLAAIGGYSQFPTFDQLYGPHANPGLQAERTTQATLGVEQALGASLRARVEVYGYSGGNLLFSPATSFRILEGRVVSPEPDAPWRNTASARSRGVELLLQRRSPRGITGWIAYGFGRARETDAADALSFDGDYDQRHTLTAFGSYRLGDTLTLTTKYRYGSGFPVPGFYEAGPGGVYLSPRRNLYRPGSYSRWDVRASKRFLFSRWKLTAYAEILNVLNRHNERYGGLRDVDLSGRVFLETDPLLPILPSVGITADF